MARSERRLGAADQFVRLTRTNEGEPNNRDREGARRAHLPHENKAASVPQSFGLGLGRVSNFPG